MTNPIENADMMKRRSRGWSDDMSGPAIARRLAVVSDLLKTYRTLQTAKKAPVSDETSARDADEAQPDVSLDESAD